VDFGHIPVVVYLTHTPRNGPVLRKWFIYLVAHQRKLAVCHLMSEELSHLLKCLIPIKVIGIDHAKRLIDLVSGGKHGMGSSPWFRTLNLLINTKLRQIVTLVYVICFDFTRQFRLEYFFEFVGKFLTDDETYFSESGSDGIINRVIDNRFAVRPEWVYLLHASIAAGHTSREN